MAPGDLGAGAARGGPARSASGRKRSRTETEDGDYDSPGSASYGQSNGATSKKRRSGGAGSRGVANLTPSQLERKRANDREAQRAIRERNKTYIESLERRIHELSTQQPQIELQAALRAKDAAEAMVADIKARLSSVLSMIQPILAGTGISPDLDQPPTLYQCPGPAYALPGHQQAQPPPSMQHASTPTSTRAASPASVGPPPRGGSHCQQHSGDPASIGPSPQAPGMQTQQQYPESKLLDQQRHELVHGLDLGAERLGLDFLLEYSTQRVARIQSGVNGAQDTPAFRHVPMKHDWANGLVQGPEQDQGQPQNRNHTQTPPQEAPQPDNSNRLRTTTRPPPPPSSYPPPTQPPPSSTPFSTPVKNCPPTCPLDALLLSFLHERHERAAEGLSPTEIAGPRHPSVSSLLNPSASRLSHPLSKVFTDILQAFPDLSALPERVAVLYVMFLIMRWQVCPTPENYDRLPAWAAPGAAQREAPHPAWVDFLPFPRMRERLVRDYYGPEAAGGGGGGGGGGDGVGFPFENFFIPYTTTLSLNWPYEDIDVLLKSPDAEELMVNPVFERHLRRLENWTLGDAFALAFPGLGGTYNLKSEDAGGLIKLAR